MDIKDVHTVIGWAEGHGGAIHPAIEVHHDDKNGIYLRTRASAPLPANAAAISCPFSLTISYFNALNIFPALPCRNPSYLPSCFPLEMFVFANGGEGNVVANFFLMLQYLLGKDSFWAEYVGSLPKLDGSGMDGTPLFYDDYDRRYLEGTQVGASLDQGERRLRKEFVAGRQIMDAADGWQMLRGKWSWEAYKWAAGIFGSRSFISTLLPAACFADCMDEATARVLFCGESRSASTCALGVLPVLFPLIDLANHVPTAKVTWFSNALGSPMDLRLVSEVEIGGSQQVYNNYAPKGNAQLLLGYGFLLEDNDDLNIAPKALVGQDLQVWKQWVGLQTAVEAMVEVPVFHVRSRPYHHAESERLRAFARFETGCVDHIALLIANQRERDYIYAHPIERPETSAAVWMCESMGRLLYATACELSRILRHMLNKIEGVNEQLPEPTTFKQRLAAQYRAGLVELLLVVLQDLAEFLEPTKATQPMFVDPVKPFPLDPKLTTLDDIYWSKNDHTTSVRGAAICRCVTSFLECEDIKESQVSTSWISKQDAESAEVEWSFTLWCFWWYIVMHNAVSTDLDQTFIATYARQLECSIDSSFPGERSELEGLEELLELLRGRITLDQDILPRERSRRMMFVAMLVKAEAVSLPRKFVHGRGNSVDRMAMCLKNADLSVMPEYA